MEPYSSWDRRSWEPRQVRLGIGALNTASLRGKSGRLYELASGQAASLEMISSRAARIVDEVINKVASLRGRLGPSKGHHRNQYQFVAGYGGAAYRGESAIRDADFAAETAARDACPDPGASWYRGAIDCNTQPQNVLALLR